MTFLPYDGEEKLNEGAFHIMEPKAKDISYREMVGNIIFLIPGMAFTTNGKRLGRGKGFYDRFLAQTEANMHKKNNTIYKIGLYIIHFFNYNVAYSLFFCNFAGKI